MNDTNDKIDFKTLILENPWRNAYWFSRMLINGDKYGSIGKENKLLAEMSSALKAVIEDKEIADDEKVSLSWVTVL